MDTKNSLDQKLNPATNACYNIEDPPHIKAARLKFPPLISDPNDERHCISPFYKKKTYQVELLTIYDLHTSCNNGKYRASIRFMDDNDVNNFEIPKEEWWQYYLTYFFWWCKVNKKEDQNNIIHAEIIELKAIHWDYSSIDNKAYEAIIRPIDLNEFYLKFVFPRVIATGYSMLAMILAFVMFTVFVAFMSIFCFSVRFI